MPERLGGGPPDRRPLDLRALQAQPVRLPALLSPGAARGGAGLPEAPSGRGIEFVSGGSSWAIFRSESPFHLYTPEEEDALCRKIRRSLAAGVLLGLLVLLGSLFLVNRLSPWFYLLSLPAALYSGRCACLAASYTGLIQSKGA